MGRRVRIYTTNTTGGGGGPAPTTVTIPMGPSFGQSAGEDTSTTNVNTATKLTKLEQNFNAHTLSQAVKLSRLKQNFNVHSTAQAVAFPSLDLNFNVHSVSQALNANLTMTNLQPEEDTYLDRANGATSFGSATTLLAKNNTAVVNDDKNTYVAWNLTGITTGTITSATLTLYMSENQAVGNTPTQIQIYTHTSKPFEETTATWNADEQPPGTLRQTIVQTVVGNTLSSYALTLNSTTRSNMLGNWIYARITGPDSGLDTTTTISIGSKEHATDNPYLDIIQTL